MFFYRHKTSIKQDFQKNGKRFNHFYDQNFEQKFNNEIRIVSQISFA